MTELNALGGLKMEIKLNISDPKTGKTYKKELKEESSRIFDLKIGDKIKGEIIGLEGYELEVTGGSNSAGFPMRKDVEGSDKKKILISGGVGFNPKRKGIRRRKTVSGNLIGDKTAQVNTKILKYGSVSLEVKENPKEEPKEEAK